MLQEPEVDSALSRKATILLGEILEIANRALPSSVAAKIQVPWSAIVLLIDFALTLRRHYQVCSTWRLTIAMVIIARRAQARSLRLIASREIGQGYSSPHNQGDGQGNLYFYRKLWNVSQIILEPTLLRSLFVVGSVRWNRIRLTSACIWMTGTSRTCFLRPRFVLMRYSSK